LADRSSRPHHSPPQLELEKANIVLELRRKKPMTAAKIAAVLHLARSTVARLLNRNHRTFKPRLRAQRPITVVPSRAGPSSSSCYTVV